MDTPDTVDTALGGRYLLRTLIARGGMGEVWSAEDSVLGRRVAVKVLLPNLAADPGFAARFKAEARAMAQLSDPGIVEVYDYGQAGGRAYLVMQFVAGESLHALVSRVGPLPPERAMALLAQAADAIHNAHAQGIVHRDVKPGNLLLRPDGRLVLTDFGIARIMAGDRMTAADEIVGTASYLAPEQVTNGPVGPATDVYALGVVAYELLTQRKPFEAESPMAVAMQHVHTEPPPLPATVPEPVRQVVTRALAKDPADRWPSAAAMARAAEHAISLSAAAPAPSEPQPTAAQPYGLRPYGLRRSKRGQSGSRPGSQPYGSRRSESLPSESLPSGSALPGSPAVASLPSESQRSPSLPGSLPSASAQPGSGPVGTHPSRARRRVLLAGAAAAVAAITFALSRNESPLLAQPGPQITPTAGVVQPPTSVAPSTGAVVAISGAPSAGPTRTASRAPGSSASTAPANPPPAHSSPSAASSPASTKRTVPNMFSWTEAEAKAELTRLGLVADISYRSVAHRCSVVEQSPPGGTVVEKGSTVDVVVAKSIGPCQQT